MADFVHGTLASLGEGRLADAPPSRQTPALKRTSAVARRTPLQDEKHLTADSKVDLQLDGGSACVWSDSLKSMVPSYNRGASLIMTYYTKVSGKLWYHIFYL